LAESKSGRQLTIYVHDVLYDCVIDHSANGYFQKRGTYKEPAKFELKIDKVTGQPVPKRGYRVVVEGADWFETLDAVWAFYEFNMRDRVVFTVG
jgi:hypothetical protein